MAEPSVTFMPLVSSGYFLSRVSYILAQQAPVVLAEASAVVGHTKRATLAAAIAASPASYAAVFAAHLVTNINVTTAGALTGTAAANTLDSPITDAAMLAAVAAIVNTVAGYVVNP